MLTDLTEQVGRGRELSPEQVALAVTQLAAEEVPAAAKADFLIALGVKGETAGEIAAFAHELRERAVRPPLDQETREGDILDVCGTGGDRLNTFNISTTVALVAASAGVRVAKHGNRAITSRSGSADVLEALGIPIDLAPEQAAQALKEHGFAFFFAPHYHPVFKHIAPARKLCSTQGRRTIFNFLGPLLNPARPTVQLIGVPVPALCENIARVLQSIGVRRGMAVSGSVGGAQLDELSILGENTVAEFYQDLGFNVSTVSPADFPLQPATLADLAGGDRLDNARIIVEILHGRDRGPKRDAVLLNSGAALFVAGVTRSWLDGWELAGRLIDEGRAAAKLAELSSSPLVPVT